MRKLMPVVLVIFVLSMSAVAGKPDRPAQWATPIKLAGVNNLHKINDNLYRSEQPTGQGMINLEKMGIKTVINLRPFHSDREIIKGTKLSIEEINVRPWHIEDEDVVNVLRIIRKKENGPFLIHCQHGADRTGVMSAMYRIVDQGWSKEEAVREMVEGGYGFHAVWSNIVNYIRDADVKKIKVKLEK